jgi:hypothetical protein
MKSRIIVLLLTVSIPTVVFSAPSNNRPEVIYGDDNRAESHDFRGPILSRAFRSTVALFSRSKLVFEAHTGSYLINPSTLKDEARVCESEPFAQEPASAFCSGALIGPDLILTAGHCITHDVECADTLIAFDYVTKAPGENPTRLGRQSVYQCKDILVREQNGAGADFGLIRLERKVVDRTPLGLDPRFRLKKGSAVYVIGSPAGLPLKLAGGARVRDPKEGSDFFTTNLDTYGGNSGSPVFNQKTHKIAGILVRGEIDFIFDPIKGCRVSKRCKPHECRGEDVTKVSVLLEHVRNFR